jgi:hypothetical protein
MSDRRQFFKGMASLPLATVLANPRMVAAVFSGLREAETILDQSEYPVACIH